MATINVPSSAVQSPRGSASSALAPAPCSCGVTADRVRYFPGQLLTADDMTAEQEYFRAKLRRHNRLLHGWGVVCGCQVLACPEATKPLQVCINPGYLITQQGDEIWIRQPVKVDLAGDTTQSPDPCLSPSPCLPAGKAARPAKLKVIYLAVCYRECQERPVRAHPVGCTCDDSACEYSRVRESLNVVLLFTPPQFPQFNLGFYGADCPACPDDSCIVVAQIELPEVNQTLGQRNIHYFGRTLLPPVAEVAMGANVTLATPADGWVGSGLNSITATFNRRIDPASILGNVFLTPDVGTSVSYDAGNRQVTLTAVDGQGKPKNFPTGQYTVTIRGGQSNVRDISGTPMPGTFTWSFTVTP